MKTFKNNKNIIDIHPMCLSNQIYSTFMYSCVALQRGHTVASSTFEPSDLRLIALIVDRFILTNCETRFRIKNRCCTTKGA